MHERFPRFLAEVFKKNSVDCLMFKNQRQVVWLLFVTSHCFERQAASTVNM